MSAPSLDLPAAAGRCATHYPRIIPKSVKTAAVSRSVPAAHIRTMTTLRREAQDPATALERLHELIHLAGDRGDGDQDAGRCK